jgi:hypothetical protein
VGQPLTFGLARKLNGDPTRHFDRAADEASERGERWLREQARDAGLSVAEFIRQWCDEVDIEPPRYRQAAQGYRHRRDMSDEPWSTDSRWMKDCIDHYWRTEKRGPTTGEILAWKEADASCRMERGD